MITLGQPKFTRSITCLIIKQNGISTQKSNHTLDITVFFLILLYGKLMLLMNSPSSHLGLKRNDFFQLWTCECHGFFLCFWEHMRLRLFWILVLTPTPWNLCSCTLPVLEMFCPALGPLVSFYFFFIVLSPFSTLWTFAWQSFCCPKFFCYTPLHFWVLDTLFPYHTHLLPLIFKESLHLYPDYQPLKTVRLSMLWGCIFTP